MMQAKTYILKLIYNLFMKNLILIPYILASEIFLIQELIFRSTVSIKFVIF